MRYKSLQDNWSSKGLLTASETSYKGLEDLAQNNQLQQITLLINFQKYWWWLNKQGNHNANLAWKCKFGQGFAKSRPAAQRPAAHGPRRPSGPAAWRPSGPRPSARDGPAARWPSPVQSVVQSWFSTVFLSSGKSMLMHRSASGLGMQNGRWWVWIRLPF